MGDDLKENLRKVLTEAGVRLPKKRRSDLSDEIHDMAIGWIESPRDRREQFLDSEARRITSKYGSGKKHYSLYLVGHVSEPSATEDQVRKHAGTYFARLERKLRKVSVRKPPRFGPMGEPEDLRVHVRSIERHGTGYKINATVRIEPPRAKAIKQAVAQTRRKGRLKIGQLVFEGMISEGETTRDAAM